MTLRYLEAARIEFEAAVQHYDGQRSGLGTRFQNTVLAVVNQIIRFPESGSVLEGEYRRCLIKKFPFGVIYRNSPDEIVIVSVSDLRRKPGHWKGRA